MLWHSKRYFTEITVCEHTQKYRKHHRCKYLERSFPLPGQGLHVLVHERSLILIGELGHGRKHSSDWVLRSDWSLLSTHVSAHPPGGTRMWLNRWWFWCLRTGHRSALSLTLDGRRWPEHHHGEVQLPSWQKPCSRQIWSSDMHTCLANIYFICSIANLPMAQTLLPHCQQWKISGWWLLSQHP